MTEHEGISVVVPVLNEAERIQEFLCSVRTARPREIIVVDGGSDDGSPQLAGEVADLVLHEGGGLSRQLNRGAAEATGAVVFFPYVDTRLPVGWRAAIERSLAAPRAIGGAFRLAFDSNRCCFRIMAVTANLRTRLRLGPLGDQSIFVRREIFRRVGGFRDDRLLEDLDLVQRLRRHGRVVIAPEAVRSSVRRWEHGGLLRTTLQNWRFLAFHFLGTGGDRLRASYRRFRVESHRLR